MANPYAILNAHCSMGTEELRALYRRACQTAHPDKGGSVESFIAVKDAYELLETSTKRRELSRTLYTSPRYTPCSGCLQKGWYHPPIKSFKKAKLSKPRICPRCSGLGFISK